MKENIYKSILKNSAFGYACHEIIFDKTGNRTDYRIIDVNPAYEKMTGLSSSVLKGSLISELYNKNENHSAITSDFYDFLSLSAESERVEYFSEKLKRWYNVQLILSDDAYITTLFEDITCLKSLQSELDHTGYLLIENERLTQISKSLTESEISYRSLFDHTIDAIYVLDGQGVFLDVNPAAMMMYGYERDEMVGFTPEKLSAPGRNDMEMNREYISRALNGEPQRFEWWGLRKNGEIFPKDLVLNKGMYLGREVVFAMARDITDRLQVLEALRESEDKYRSLTEQLPVGVYRTTIDGSLIYSNMALANILEYNSVEELLKINVNQLYANLASRKKQLSDADNRSGIVQSEFQLKRKDGELIWVRDNSRLQFDKNGNPVYFDGIIEDITEIKRVALQLQYQSDLRKLLVELSSGFINLPVRDINEAINQSLIKIGEFVGADRSYVFEYDFQNYTASNTIEWCRPGIDPQIENLKNIPVDQFMQFVTAHSKGEILKVDNVEDLPQNSLRNLMEMQDVKSLLTIPLVKEGRCIGFVGFDSVRKTHVYNDYEQQLLQVYAQTLVNVLERLEKEEKLIAAKEKAEESDRLKSAFLANMSHEIRTPMSGIIGFLNLLNEPDLSDENKSAYINIVTQSGLRLLDTINDIIEISRIESGGLQVNLSPVDVSELLGYYSGFFRQQTTQKGLDYLINNYLPPDIRYFNSDKKKLDSIISNLIKNAIKFTPSGSVEFGCRLEEQNLIFYVKDSGVGIPEERLNFIFERFVQGDLSTSRPHEGSGLGLAIVKAYSEMLGGNIVVQSKEGIGTTFTFSISYVPVEERRVKTADRTAKDEVIRSGSRILIAEDDYASYLYIQKSLTGEGIAFLRTTNGEDTVKIVRENPDISVILMDIKMPGMTGLEATRRIREFNPKVPIIAQTAYSLSGDRELAIEAGCNDYISKPINRKELQNLVKKHTGMGL